MASSLRSSDLYCSLEWQEIDREKQELLKARLNTLSIVYNSLKSGLPVPLSTSLMLIDLIYRVTLSSSCVPNEQNKKKKEIEIEIENKKKNENKDCSRNW